MDVKLLVVAAFASRFASDRVQDRYLFFLAPLLVGVLSAWDAHGAPRPRGPLVAGSVLAVGLVVAFPYVRFIGEPAKSDTFGLIPLWTANQHLVLDSYRWTVLLAALALVALFAFVPARRACLSARTPRIRPRPLSPQSRAPATSSADASRARARARSRRCAPNRRRG